MLLDSSTERRCRARKGDSGSSCSSLLRIPWILFGGVTLRTPSIDDRDLPACRGTPFVGVKADDEAMEAAWNGRLSIKVCCGDTDNRFVACKFVREKGGLQLIPYLALNVLLSDPGLADKKGGVVLVSEATSYDLRRGCTKCVCCGRSASGRPMREKRSSMELVPSLTLQGDVAEDDDEDRCNGDGTLWCIGLSSAKNRR
jgi:hypothetical protein